VVKSFKRRSKKGQKIIKSAMAGHFYDFGPFRIDLRNRLLLRAGEPIPVTPKAFDTLLAF
jgi:DNA-binding response OmpR family regulator